MSRLGVDGIDALICDSAFHEAKSPRIHAIAVRPAAEFSGVLGRPGRAANVPRRRSVPPPGRGHRRRPAAHQRRYPRPPRHQPLGRRPHADAGEDDDPLEAVLPQRYWVEIKRLLVPFGKHICTGVRPVCLTCPLLEMCRQVGVTAHRSQARQVFSCRQGRRRRHTAKQKCLSRTRTLADHPLPYADGLPKRVRPPAANAPADRDLLDRFVAAAEIRRRSPGWSKPRANGPAPLPPRPPPHPDAEDACQAAFLVLARKASLHSQEKGAGQLAARGRLPRRLQPAAGRVPARGPPGAPARGRPAGSRRGRQLGRSQDGHRPGTRPFAASLPRPLILCYLEERTRDEAARLLGWGEGTLRGRLERGRSALRARLIRRGIGLSSVLLAGALEGGAVSPARAPVRLHRWGREGGIGQGRFSGPGGAESHVL